MSFTQASATSFARALSPIAQSFANIGVSDDDQSKAAAEARRRAPYQGAESLDQLAVLLPVEYRDTLVPAFREIHSLATKKQRAADQVQHWEAAKAKGVIPKEFAWKAPPVQFSSAFVSSQQAASEIAKINEVVESSKRSLLDAAIAAKKQEVDHISGNLAPKELYSRLLAEVNKVYLVLAERKEPRVVHSVPSASTSAASAMEVDSGSFGGERVVWETPASVTRQHANLCLDIVYLAFRVMGFVERDHARSKLLTIKKKEKADETKESVASQSKDIPSIVRAEVKKALSNNPPPKKVPKPSGILKKVSKQRRQQADKKKQSGPSGKKSVPAVKSGAGKAPSKPSNPPASSSSKKDKGKKRA
ncbi:hypothetical protein VKT23_013950 [Stygiomarasmius scandens]|uniref:Uncharacterized protein n=1 Tax=Marasmiellus scandens TaxID=2682957 RepID=A0ABR1J1K7_9AGAR